MKVDEMNWGIESEFGENRGGFSGRFFGAKPAFSAGRKSSIHSYGVSSGLVFAMNLGRFNIHVAILKEPKSRQCVRG